MSLKNDAFPSSAAFDAISASLSSDDAGRKDAIKKGGAVFAFTLKNAAGDTDSWHIDLKEKGCVGKGDAPEGGKANEKRGVREGGRKSAGGGGLERCVRGGQAGYAIGSMAIAPRRLPLDSAALALFFFTLLLSDADFAKLTAGKANAQRLFMSGKLRIRGDVMKATKMEPILKKAQMGAKL
ncbi:sterol-binding-like protein [Cenococcum geophilum]